MFDRGGFFDEFDREFEEMSRMMDRMMRRMRGFDWASLPPDQPVYYGVSVNVGPDGIPHVEQFGNVRPREGVIESGVREPFVSTIVDETQNKVRVTAEMPGVDKESVEVEVRGGTLRLRAKGEDRAYEKSLRLGVAVDAESAKAHYNNGVLEVTLDLADPTGREGHSVKVE